MADVKGFQPTVIADPKRFTVYATDTVSGVVTELWRVLDADGNVSYEKAIDGTAYTPAATETIDRMPQRVQLGDEALPVPTGTTVVQLASVPGNARRAEVHVWGNEVVWTTNGTDPDAAAMKGRRSNDGATFELEGDELETFKVLTLDADGDAGLWVEYFNNEIAPFE